MLNYSVAELRILTFIRRPAERSALYPYKGFTSQAKSSGMTSAEACKIPAIPNKNTIPNLFFIDDVFVKHLQSNFKKSLVKG